MPTSPATDDPSDELRSSRRCGLRQPCKVTMLRDGSSRTCELRDLSGDGLSFMSFRPVSPGTRLRVEFELALDGQALPVQVAGRASYSSFQGSEGFRIGVRFAGADEASRRAILAFVERVAGATPTRPAPLDGNH
jgi:hypothetical protein